MARFGKIFVLFSLLGLVILAACSQSPHSKTSSNPSYSEDSAMAHFNSEPERSIALLDSAVAVGNISEPRGAYLKAIVVYSGLNRPDSCINMCKKILDDEIYTDLPDSEDVKSYQVDVCQLIATAATTNNDYADVLHFAQKGAALAHGEPKLKTEEADLYSRMGYTMCHMGQTVEGMENMSRASEMLKNDQSWEALLGSINNDKKIVSTLNTLERYNEALRLLKQVFGRLARVKKYPKTVKGIPQFMLEDSSALNEYVDFNLTELYQLEVRTFIGLNKKDSAEFYIQKFEQTPESNNPQMSQDIIIDLAKLGQFDKATSRIAAQKAYYKNDTIRSGYVELLTTEAYVAKMQGHYPQASALYEKVNELKDSVSMRNNSSQLTRLATEFNLQEEHLARQDAETNFKVLLFSAITVLLIFVLLVIYIQMRHIKKKHKAVQDLYHSSKEELEDTRGQLKDTREQLDVANQKINDMSEKETNEPVSPEELYQRALQVMEVQKPYTSPDFNIQMLAKLIFSSRTYTSLAINKQAGVNFRKWLANYRVDMAKALLLSNQGLTTDEIVSKCGFESRSTFYRQFRTVTGMTPKEYLEKNG